MNNHFRKLYRKLCGTKLTILCLAMLLSNTAVSGIVPEGTEIGVLQFDGILELNAPHFQKHILLFVRYWVSPQFYSASVVWAEPHVGSLHFPLYPPTLVIDSNQQSFSISNYVHSMYNSVFSKPLEKRGVFRYMFNDYPIPNIRFAEPEALASRIYTNDLEKLGGQNKDDWQTIDVRNSTNEKGIYREVAKLNLRVTDGRIEALNLLDAKEQLIKSIEYEYSRQKCRYLLRKQNVVLAERPFTVGFRGKGVITSLDGEEHTYRKLEGTHHRGTRKCSVNYESTNIGDQLLALPVRVVVYTGDGETILRSSRLLNFKQVELNADKAKKSAEAFGCFDSKERKCREMLLKYWMKEPAEIEDADLKILKQLRTHFENTTVNGETIGEKLKRINMIMELDWIQGDHALKKHFKQYLAILAANDLKLMTLVGGQHVIETTIEWRQFSVADHLLHEWVYTAVAINAEKAILHFGESAIRKGRFWTLAKLMEKSLKSSRKWGQKRFNAETLKCMAIHRLYEMLQKPDKIKTSFRIAQSGWVSSSASIDSLLKTLNESIAEAQQTFANLDTPTQKQKALKEELDTISQKIERPEN